MSTIDVLRFVVPFACAGVGIAAGVAVRWVLRNLEAKGALEMEVAERGLLPAEERAEEPQVLAPYREAPRPLGYAVDERDELRETIEAQLVTIEALERRLLRTALIPGACFDGASHDFNPIYHYCQRCGGKAEK